MQGKATDTRNMRYQGAQEGHRYCQLVEESRYQLAVPMLAKVCILTLSVNTMDNLERQSLEKLAYHNLLLSLLDNGEISRKGYQRLWTTYLNRYDHKPHLLSNGTTLALFILGVVLSVGLISYSVFSLASIR
jgi:hypothetical protein